MIYDSFQIVPKKFKFSICIFGYFRNNPLNIVFLIFFKSSSNTLVIVHRYLERFKFQ